MMYGRIAWFLVLVSWVELSSRKYTFCFPLTITEVFEGFGGEVPVLERKRLRSRCAGWGCGNRGLFGEGYVGWVINRRV